MSSTLLEQADALMRRRSFVAGSKLEQTDAEARGAYGNDNALEDVPLLTDVVSDDALPATVSESGFSLGHAKPISEPSSRKQFDQLLADRQSLLTQEIEAWLDEQMPQLVIRAMDGITDHLVALLANRVKDELLPRLECALKPPDVVKMEADSAD